MWQPVLAIAAGPSWSLCHAGCSSHVRMWSLNGCSDPEKYYCTQNEHKMNQSSQNSWLWNRDPLSLRNASIEAESLCKSVTVPILFSSTTPRFLLLECLCHQHLQDLPRCRWNMVKHPLEKPFEAILSNRVLFQSYLYSMMYIYIYIFISIYGFFKIQHLILPPVSKSLL